MSDEAAPRAHVRTPESEEVLRRIGRNVVIFQQVEHLLPGGGMRTIYRINERYELLVRREPLTVEINGADAGSDRP